MAWNRHPQKKQYTEDSSHSPKDVKQLSSPDLFPRLAVKNRTNDPGSKSQRNYLQPEDEQNKKAEANDFHNNSRFLMINHFTSTTRSA